MTQSPRTSAMVRAIVKDDHLWGLNEQLLAVVADGIHNLVWMKTEDGSKGRNRPKPIPRPGVTPETEVTKGTSMTMEEAEQWLAANSRRI